MTDLAPAPTLPRSRAIPVDVVDPFSIGALRDRGGATALIVDRGARRTEVSYAELAERVERRGVELGRRRRLVALRAHNDVESIVTLLAALDRGHPLIMTDGSSSASNDPVLQRYAPDTVVSVRDGHAAIDHHTAIDRGSRHRLHDDLALLMSTSGTTGGSKLVRLSADGVRSNARAIASALELTEHDRAIASLPLHYCYGLSVVTSHLAVGGSFVLTPASVVDPCFWRAIERDAVTTLAGVPYTFEMIQRLGLDVLRAPSLRIVTQAGGRLDPADVRRFAGLGREAGWSFSVMYGQTEATARMAVSRPGDASTSPHTVGHAIPGGSFRIDQPNREGIGEVVYRGPNVMMGYADTPSDLALGRVIDELRTGDLGRLDDRGRLELVGRVSRFVKLHGKRVDLDHLESRLSSPARRVRCAGDDEGLVVVTDASGGTDALDPDLRAAAAAAASLPEGRILAANVAVMPRTASGKVDGPALVSAVRELAARQASSDIDDTVADAFRLVLGLDHVERGATFAGLGGDSFSYVEMSVRLERLLGDLPADWHLTPIADLERRRIGRRPPSRWWRSIETSVVIRAVAIVLIVCTHMRLFRLAGGAHTLLAVLGYNFARFQLLPHDVPGRLRRAAATVGRVAVPTSAWIGLNMLVVGGYSLGAALLVNNYTGAAERRGGRWEYWYFEAFVQVMIVLALVFAIPAVRRTERRAPFAFALAVLAATLVVRFDLVQWGGTYNEMFRTHTVACFVALGWCAQRATNVAQRLIVTALAVVTTVGYFGQTDRELRIIVMIAALTWIPAVRLPTPIVLVVAPVAAASMWTFLVHWQVWPVLTPLMRDEAALVLTIAAGVGVWWAIGRAATALRPLRGQLRRLDRRTRSHVSDADTAISSSAATPVSA